VCGPVRCHNDKPGKYAKEHVTTDRRLAGDTLVGQKDKNSSIIWYRVASNWETKIPEQYALCR